MSVETLSYCNCAQPIVALDKITGQEYDLVCGGVIPDEDEEMAKIEGMDFDVY